MALTQISTAGVKDDAVTAGKIPADAIGSSEIAANAVGSTELANNAVNTVNIANVAVTSGKIADSAITNSKVSSSAAISGTKLADNSIPLAKLPNGDSNNNGKFLQANNGATPSFETVSIPAGTTINNNADNRVITGSGTANTLEGEADLTYDGTNLSIPNGINHTGDTNTAIRFPANDNISMESAGSEIFRVTPDAAHGSSHSIQLKSAHVVDGAAVTIGGTKGDSAGIARGMLNIRDSSAYNVTDNGGSVGFSAVFNSGGSHTTMSQIEGVKANNTDGNYEGAIDFYTRHHNGDMIKKARIGLNGLSFQNDTAAANCLDDYEEGGWTPTVSYSNGGSATLSEAVGHYTKIGRKVHVQYAITVSAQGGGSGNVHVNGLPISTGSTTGFRLNGHFTYQVNFNVINSMIVTYVPGAGNAFKLYHFGSTGTSSGVTNVTRNHIQANTEWRGHATYYVD